MVPGGAIARGLGRAVEGGGAGAAPDVEGDGDLLVGAYGKGDRVTRELPAGRDRDGARAAEAQGADRVRPHGAPPALLATVAPVSRSGTAPWELSSRMRSAAPSAPTRTT